MAVAPVPSMPCTHLLQGSMHCSNLLNEGCHLLLHARAGSTRCWSRVNASSRRMCERAAGMRCSCWQWATGSTQLPSCISGKRLGPCAARSCAAVCKASSLQPLVQLCHSPPERQLPNRLPDMTRQPSRLSVTQACGIETTASPRIYGFEQRCVPPASRNTYLETSPLTLDCDARIQQPPEQPGLSL